MTEKNPAAVELGRLGGRVKSEAKTLAAQRNATRPRRKGPRRKRALDLLHAAVAAEAAYRLELINSSRRDSVAVRQHWLESGDLPY